MNNDFKFSDWIMTLSKWFMRLTLSNIIWFVLNIPTFFILYSWYFSDVREALIHFMLFVLVFTVIFYPTTQSLFQCVREWILDDETSVLSHYFRYLVQTYRSNLKDGLIFSIIWLIWILDVFYLYEINHFAWMIFCIIGLLLIAFQINYFCFKAHFDMNFKTRFKMASLTIIGSPILTFSLIILVTIMIYIMFYKLTFLIPFLSGSIIAFLSFLLFNHWTIHIQSKKEQSEQVK